MKIINLSIAKISNNKLVIAAAFCMLSFSPITSAQSLGPFECATTFNDKNDYQFSGSAIIIAQLPTDTQPNGYAQGYCFYKPVNPSAKPGDHKKTAQEIRITADDMQVYNNVNPGRVWEKTSIPIPYFDGFKYITTDYACGTLMSVVSNNKPLWVSANSSDPKLCQALSKAQVKNVYKANFVAAQPIQNDPLIVKCFKSGSTTSIACNTFFDNNGSNQAKLYGNGGDLYLANDVDKINIVWGSEHEMDNDPKKTCLGLSKEQLEANTITLTWNKDGFFGCSPAGTANSEDITRLK